MFEKRDKMTSEIRALCNIYAEIIRANNVNSTAAFEYECVEGYYHSRTTLTKCLLSEIRATDVYFGARDGFINVAELQLSDKQELFYQSCITAAEYDFTLATDMYIYNLCRNKNDAERMRDLALHLYRGENILFDDEDFIKQMKLSAEEIQFLFRQSLCKPFNMTRLLTEHYSSLTNDLKHRIISLLRLDRNQAIYYLYNSSIPLDFQMTIFNTLFTKEDYYDIFFQIYSHVAENNKIRTIVFNTIITDPNVLYDSFQEHITNLSKHEKMLICNKFYKQIFPEDSAFKAFFHNCCVFGLWLRTNERLRLIQKLRTKTRVQHIPYAKQRINFTDSELNQLQSIELAYKLK